ncbi:MAG: hypothetical protein F4X81_18445 [Gammaproteobacteria bacterium]|nr:hypothetical protein [Gammaproteobacteria bacterium]MXY06237.1 hypothetical protein [Gammaproteobacteria bacterium]MYE53436.1 hypothetical protein [Gammaproteobacteria bacterium]MYG14632.1 hypothetical protein [Gammaproteobacteria bacterium]MYK29210.1 hypothetical protein [Gammaproteobacteria bacterium]
MRTSPGGTAAACAASGKGEAAGIPTCCSSPGGGPTSSGAPACGMSPPGCNGRTHPNGMSTFRTSSGQPTAIGVWQRFTAATQTTSPDRARSLTRCCRASLKRTAWR